MESIYQNALILMKGALYREAAAEFDRIPDYKDSLRLKAECEKKYEESKIDEIYDTAVRSASVFTVSSQKKAIRLFKSIPGWRDSDELIKASYQKIEEIKKTESDRREEVRIRDEKKLKKRRRWRKALIASALAIAAAVGLHFGGSYIYKNKIEPIIKYNKASAMIESGDLDGAYRLLKGLDYKDSIDKVGEIAQERLKAAEVGSTVFFGAYEQDGNISNGMEPIEWLVVDRNGSDLLLVSKHAIESSSFHWATRDGEITTWSDSTLRAWLNDKFINTVFEQPERRIILRSSVPAEFNPEYDTDPGLDTKDKIFILSISEVLKYFPEESDRLCSPTPFALKCGAYVGDTDYTWWWLRNPGFDSYPSRMVVVSSQGIITSIGHYVTCPNYGVRPAIWIKTN